MTGQLVLVARAESLSDHEDWVEAAAAWQTVVDANPVSGAHWVRLGDASYAAGDHATALTALRRAEELGVWAPGAVHLDDVLPGELRYRTARCHARLGDTAAALVALEEAVAQGLRDVERAAADAELAVLHGDPRFRVLVDPPDTAGVSRVDGWRADLDVLRRTVQRRVPFRDVLDAAWATAYDELVAAIPELDDARVVVGMWGLLRRLGDGHARLDTAEAFPAWEACLPLWFYLFEEGVFVPHTEPALRDVRGAQVLAFDGRPVAEVVEALDPLLTQDNRYGPLASIPGWLRRPVFLHALGVLDDPARVTLTVRRPDGVVAEVPVATEAASRPGLWPQPEVPYFFGYEHSANLVHLHFNSIADQPDEPLAAFFERVFTTVDEHGASLVVDLRWNGGGNTFLAQPLLRHVLRRPGLRVYVVVGRATFSAAQNTATVLGRHTDAVFVGEPSGSSPNFVGETAPFRLPYSRIRANVSDVYWQTSWPFDHRTAIPPDIYAPPTFAEHQAGRDPALEAIRDHLSSVDGGA